MKIKNKDYFTEIQQDGRIKVKFPSEIMKEIHDMALLMNTSDEEVINQLLSKMSINTEEKINRAFNDKKLQKSKKRKKRCKI